VFSAPSNSSGSAISYSPRQIFADAVLGFDPQTVRQTTDRHWTWMADVPSLV
jgi:hypothetical protein